MRTSLQALLAEKRVLLADGATGTNYFQMGLTAGEPPEFWNLDHPDRVKGLYQQFVDAGADLFLTNTFGCNRHRLKLHNAQSRTYEIAKLAAELAREVADAADRPVVVAGSVGPTGELFAPLGALTEEEAIDTFAEQCRGLKDGGADVAWIETMSSAEEVRAAANGAIQAGLAYTATCSFDTAGRTMMGIMPGDLPAMFEGLSVQPIAMGANCGVGASDILVSLLHMTEAVPGNTYICKGNCGVPKFVGTEAVYSGTPDLMAKYARFAADAGVRIIGGCCGTSPEHLAAMRGSLDAWLAGETGSRPSMEEIIDAIGPMANSAPTQQAAGEGRARRGRR